MQRLTVYMGNGIPNGEFTAPWIQALEKEGYLHIQTRESTEGNWVEIACYAPNGWSSWIKRRTEAAS